MPGLRGARSTSREFSPVVLLGQLAGSFTRGGCMGFAVPILKKNTQSYIEHKSESWQDPSKSPAVPSLENSGGEAQHRDVSTGQAWARHLPRCSSCYASVSGGVLPDTDPTWAPGRAEFHTHCVIFSWVHVPGNHKGSQKSCKRLLFCWVGVSLISGHLAPSLSWQSRH